MKPMIGISINESMDAGEQFHHLPIAYVPNGYVSGVISAGGLPMLLPIGSVEMAESYADLIDKLILTGGQNVSPVLYGDASIHPPELNNSERDQFEMALIDAMLKREKPIFGVCRGLQLLNVYLGGTLHQDLSLRSPEPIKHMQAPVSRDIATHHVLFSEDSQLYNLYGPQLSVNSFHFQSINRIGSGLKVTGLSSDGIIEAVESQSPQKKILGVQWHPDFICETDVHAQNLFEYVVQTL